MNLGLGLNIASTRSAGSLITPFDTFTPTTGYSLRNLSIGYSGNVVRVREDSGNTEQDFTASEITDGTLSTFVGANNGYIRTWYDQFGSNDATQTTAANQPKIWDATTGLVTENGRPALDFDGSDDVLKIADFAYNVAGGKLTMFTVALSESSTGGNQYVFAHYETSTPDRSWAILFDSDDRFRGAFSSDGSGIQFIQFDSFSFGTQYLNYFIFDTSLSVNDRIDGAYNGIDFTFNNSGGNENSIYDSAGDLTISRANTPFNGLIQEIVFYDSDQSANREAIEDNINDYYDIY